MKKLLCVLLSIILVVTVSVSAIPVFAAQADLADTGALLSAPTLSFECIRAGVNMTVNLPSNQAWYYRYYVKTSANGSWSRIGSDTKSNRITYITGQGGKTYYFTVRCVKNNTFLTTFKSHSVYYCSTPTSLKAEHMSKGIKVTWDRMTGASKYRVYRKTSGTSWKAIANVSGTIYTDTASHCDTTNFYTVRVLDSNGRLCSGYEEFGASCYQGGNLNTVSVVNQIEAGIRSGNSNVTKPNRYWSYSNIPEGADWCTGFANYVIGKSCGSWRFAGEWHSGATWNSNYEESTGHGNYNNPADWHPYTSVWSRWAYNDDIFYQPNELIPSKGDIIFFRRDGQSDTFDNVGHVGIVWSANKNTIVTLEGNGNGKSAPNSQVCKFTYNKCGNTWKSASSNPGSVRLVSGFIRMKDVYNRMIYK